MLWIGILVGALGCYLLKLAGLSVPRGVLERPRVQRIAALLPIVLLSALVAVQTFSYGPALVLDARAAGLAVAGVAVWRRRHRIAHRCAAADRPPDRRSQSGEGGRAASSSTTGRHREHQG